MFRLIALLSLVPLSSMAQLAHPVVFWCEPDAENLPGIELCHGEVRFMPGPASAVGLLEFEVKTPFWMALQPGASAEAFLTGWDLQSTAGEQKIKGMSVGVRKITPVVSGNMRFEVRAEMAIDQGPATGTVQSKYFKTESRPNALKMVGSVGTVYFTVVFDNRTYSQPEFMVTAANDMYCTLQGGACSMTGSYSRTVPIGWKQIEGISGFSFAVSGSGGVPVSVSDISVAVDSPWQGASCKVNSKTWQAGDSGSCSVSKSSLAYVATGSRKNLRKSLGFVSGCGNWATGNQVVGRSECEFTLPSTSLGNGRKVVSMLRGFSFELENYWLGGPQRRPIDSVALGVRSVEPVSEGVYGAYGVYFSNLAGNKFEDSVRHVVASEMVSPYFAEGQFEFVSLR